MENKRTVVVWAAIDPHRSWTNSIKRSGGLSSDMRKRVKLGKSVAVTLGAQMEPKSVSSVPAAVIQRQERKMSRGMPSMTALLGLLALAGYQARRAAKGCRQQHAAR
jgi:hypothetical protein